MPKSSQRTPFPPKTLTVAGIMSGTSADGVDVALCRISPLTAANPTPRLKLLAHRAFPYAPVIRTAVLAAMNAPQISTADLARLSWRLGQVYADAVAETLARTGLHPDLIALHGQTLFHETTPADFLNAPTRSTWQAGEPALLAERFRLPVISDFRSADLAAGGQGAPLVPMLDYTLFRHKTRNRILLNLGGIANLTALPADTGPEAVLAFDTGPANMVIDAAIHHLTGKAYDCGGSMAAKGQVLEPILKDLLTDPYFTQQPPKSCGREQFGANYTTQLLTRAQAENASPRDILATATALTADSILEAYRRFLWPHLGQRAPLAKATDLIISGGGARNQTLLKRLRAHFEPLYVKVSTTDDLGLPAEAKEAAAFALLGWLTWHNLPGNIPSATGATRPVILGRITPVSNGSAKTW